MSDMPLVDCHWCGRDTGSRDHYCDNKCRNEMRKRYKHKGGMKGFIHNELKELRSENQKLHSDVQACRKSYQVIRDALASVPESLFSED